VTEAATPALSVGRAARRWSGSATSRLPACGSAPSRRCAALTLTLTLTLALALALTLTLILALTLTLTRTLSLSLSPRLTPTPILTLTLILILNLTQILTLLQARGALPAGSAALWEVEASAGEGWRAPAAVRLIEQKPAARVGALGSRLLYETDRGEQAGLAGS
jgi:hypothetical protein